MLSYHYEDYKKFALAHTKNNTDKEWPFQGNHHGLRTYLVQPKLPEDIKGDFTDGEKTLLNKVAKDLKDNKRVFANEKLNNLLTKQLGLGLIEEEGKQISLNITDVDETNKLKKNPYPKDLKLRFANIASRQSE
jgi:hypothetical protein